MFIGMSRIAVQYVQYVASRLRSPSFRGGSVLITKFSVLLARPGHHL